ncbi:MAG TPA: c-type cytochrome biogenesis protein CcsB [Propionibacteriaceae bacterium]|nr:c-type cytochrome biogenesis protein CcsB [Propionibacteriaceae bacterium]
MIEYSQYLLVVAGVLVVLSLLMSLAIVLVPQTATRRVAQPAMAGAGAGGGPLTLDVARPPAPRPQGLSLYATAFSWLALAFLTASLVLRAIVTGHGPFANQHEFAVSFAWGILAAYLYFEWRHQARALAPFALAAVGVMLLYASTTDSDVRPLVPALRNSWLLTLHVFTAVLSYGAAAIGGAAAVLYLLHPRLHWRGLPKREFLDEIGYRSIVISYPFMTVMILLGAIWAEIAWGTYWSWDPKETSALVTWLIYGAYLHARVTREWRGEKAAWLLIAGFAAIVLTFVGNTFFGGLHSYA